MTDPRRDCLLTPHLALFACTLIQRRRTKSDSFLPNLTKTHPPPNYRMTRIAEALFFSHSFIVEWDNIWSLIGREEWD